MKDKVKTIIYSHGIYSMLMALKHYQDNEYYEQCIYIKEALDEVSKGREQWHTSSLDSDNVNRIIEDIKENHPIIYKNMELYISQVLMKLFIVFDV